MLIYLCYLTQKIDDSFRKGQFLIKGFGDPFRIDRNVNGGRILFYVREDLPEKASICWNRFFFIMEIN